MPDVLLVDGPLRGQLAPLPEYGGIYADNPAAGGLVTYTLSIYSLLGRRIYVGTCEYGPDSEQGRAALWEILASPLAKSVAVMENYGHAGHTQAPEVRHVFSSDSMSSDERNSGLQVDTGQPDQVA